MTDKLYLDKLKGRITESDYDRFYQSFREQIAELDTQLGMLQEAEDNYYITAKYLLELANRAYELFKSSEVEERRQLIKLVLSNLRVEGNLVQYDAIKPFDTVLNYSDHQLWHPRRDYLFFLRKKWNQIKDLVESLNGTTKLENLQ